MKIRRSLTVLLAASWSVWLVAQEPARLPLPERLADQEFWRLTDDLSEPNGAFRSDNLLSNEMRYPDVLDQLAMRTRNGGAVYLGVGPEQNYHYLAAIKPKMAFVVDVRRGNLHLQLMYKALFDLSADRAEFVSRLFTKKRPANLGTSSTVGDLMNAYWDISTGDKAAYDANLQAITDDLTKRHGFPLSPDDLAGIAYVYYNFYWFGPSINYNSSSSGSSNGRSSYADLMMSTDMGAHYRGFLASEDDFRFLKDLEARNMLVPVVGNFAGPKALRAVGRYIRDHGATVAAYYLSNVEQYLYQDGIWGSFCANVATLPLTEKSTFIRSQGGQILLGDMQSEVKGCAGPSGRGR